MADPASHPHITLNVDGAFTDEAALREMIRTRRVCFDHDPFYVRDGFGHLIQIGFQLNLYAAFGDPHHLPHTDDREHREIVQDLNRICRVFFQSLDVLKPCEHPDPPVHRIIYSPERHMRAEVAAHIHIFDREHFGAKPGRPLTALLETAECLLKSIGACYRQWDDAPPSVLPHACAESARDAHGVDASAS